MVADQAIVDEHAPRGLARELQFYDLAMKAFLLLYRGGSRWRPTRYGSAAPSGCQPPGGVYFTTCFVAASISSGERSTTVRTVAPPPAVTARASAAAASLSGRSAIVYTSLPPNAK